MDNFFKKILSKLKGKCDPTQEKVKVKEEPFVFPLYDQEEEVPTWGKELMNELGQIRSLVVIIIIIIIIISHRIGEHCFTDKSVLTQFPLSTINA